MRSDGQPTAPRTSEESDSGFRSQAPTIQLPKGGGAIRGIGEKFAANPVTGAGSMTVPIATSPGRSGFGPQLSLQYDSGAGNGPFGFGWSLSLPSIARKTEKGLPKYLDAVESDTFILSGTEDLVPTLVEGGDGAWAPEVVPPRTIDGRTFSIRRYRPRVEGLFARIERWTNTANSEDVHWRSISKDNILTLYGADPESRIFDPSDPARIFSWLICETRDDKGNAILYRYRADDGDGVSLGRTHERNRGARTDRRRAANRYLKRIHYGNRTSLLDTAGNRPPFLDRNAVQTQIQNGEWMFEVVFDYGEHGATPLPNDAGAWAFRADPFSSYRSGFEVRTTRLCRRVLMFHHFAGRVDVERDCLVRSTNFTYSSDIDPTDARNPVYTFLQSVKQSGHRRRAAGGYDEKSVPPLEFEYTKPVVQDAVEEVDPSSLENLPVGIDGSRYRWVDLHGEGIPGVLSEQAGAWFYKRNLSPVPRESTAGDATIVARFSALERVALKPNADFAVGAEILDLAGDGQPDVVIMNDPTPGFYEHDEDEGWQSFRPFASRLNRDVRDPNLKFIDLDGDGHADVLITESDALIWHASLAEAGFGPARRVVKELDEEKGPRIVFADGTDSIYLADLSGDGLTDIVRIRNGEVCYWPNLGHGRFGGKVTMDNSPRFDHPDRFDQRRIRLADIDGSGTTDILYLHADGVRLYFNQSGNGWSQPRVLNVAPAVDEPANIVPVDLLGNGTTCLVWSSSAVAAAQRPMRYVNLVGANKPHLLIKIKNNLGATTEVTYAPSTKFYLQDKRDGRPWITRLPFPVHVVERVSVKDKWRRTTFVTACSYHHGYFDGAEREFRGFGRIEQVDSETYEKFSAGNTVSPYITSDKRLYQPPVKSISWFHTGVALAEAKVLSLYEHEYFPASLGITSTGTNAFRENSLPEPDFGQADLTVDEWREAHRACKGALLRREIYELDVDAFDLGAHRPVKLFSTAYRNCSIERLQPKSANRNAVFRTAESETITYHYELDLRAAQANPDPRVSHTFNLRFDKFGNVLQSVAVGYPRFSRFADTDLNAQTVNLVRVVQSELHIAYTETRFTEVIDDPDMYRTGMPCEVQTYALTGFAPQDASDSTTADPRDNRYFSIDELRAYRLSDRYQTSGAAVGRLHYHEQPDGSINPQLAQKRLVELARTLYYDDVGATGPTQPLPFGEHGPRGLKYEDYKLALTDDLLAAVFGTKLGESMRGSTATQKLRQSGISGYLSGVTLANRFAPLATTGEYWMRSGTVSFGAAARFFLPERFTDAFGGTTESQFNAPDLYYVELTRDSRANESRVVDFDFRVLAPSALRSVNGNVTRTALDILGMPVAVAMEAAGDSVAGLTGTALDPPSAQLEAFFGLDSAAPSAYSEALPRAWLNLATTRYIYHFGERVQGGVTVYEAAPPAAGSIQRETHVAKLGGNLTKLQVSVEYSDGGGNVLVKKAQAEPAPGGSVLRWIANGKTILNNKGKPVKQYEPYFSRVEHRFDEAEATDEVGVTPVMYYDAPGRLIRTELPDGTLSRVEFSPWQVKSFDASDTAFDADLAKCSDWYRRRKDPTHRRYAEFSGTENIKAAELAEKHANTPAQTHLDSLGRQVVAIAHNRTPDDAGVWQDDYYVTFTKLDAEGKPLWIRDARGNLMMQYIAPPMSNNAISNDFPFRTDTAGNRIYSAPCYDLAGNLLFQHSMDAGDRWMLTDAAGHAMLAWDANDQGSTTPEQRRVLFTEYDELHRPVRQWLKIDAGAEALIDVVEYCDTNQPNGATGLADAQQRNLIGQAVTHWEPSGRSTVDRIDLCGKPAHVTRTLIDSTAGANGFVNWEGSLTALLDTETFHRITEFDALGRMTALYNWHRDITFAGGVHSTPGKTDRVAVYVPKYNERGALKSEELHVRATKSTAADGRVGFVSNSSRRREAIEALAYNVKGQRLTLTLGNGTITTYTYDDESFRLLSLRTQRVSAPKGVQALSYIYDPSGNVTFIEDVAQKIVYTNNTAVRPEHRYVYDAIYRLIEATGRENPAALAPPKSDEGRWIPGSLPTNARPRNYTQRYAYDAAGNVLEMMHSPSTATGWTRTYTTKQDSNRLDQTWYGAKSARAVTYRHDAHGNLLNLNRIETPPALDNDERWALHIEWDWRDMIHRVDCIGGGTATYTYGIDKQRTRKRVERVGSVVEDRIYLGGYELYRRRNSTGVVEEIESHHLLDGEQRVLLVDDVIVSSKGVAHARSDGLTVRAQTLFRYQYGNHLGSASLELDDDAEIISYEEYHPYGSSAYRAMKDTIEAPPKRYRFTGMERDEESGLSYHSARYLAPQLARWMSADPASLAGGTNVYAYSHLNPLHYSDRNGRQPDPFVDQSLQSIIQEVHNSRPDLMSRAVPTEPAGPFTAYKTARSQASTGQRAFRVANNLVGNGGVVQAGHTMQVEASVATQLARGTRDNPATMMALHSRVNPAFQVQSTTNAGTPVASVAGKVETSANIPWESTNTRHTAQEALIENAASRPMAGPVTQAEARGAQVSGSEEVLWRTENTPWDQRNAEAVTASKASSEAERIESSAAVKAYRASKSSMGVFSKVKAVGGPALGMAADVADAATSKDPLYVTLKVGTAATQGTGGMLIASGLAAGAPQAVALGTTIASAGAAASLAVSTVALAVHDTKATLEGKPTAAYQLGKAMADLVVEGEAQGGFVGGAKQALGWGLGVPATMFAVAQGEGLWAPFNYQR